MSTTSPAAAPTPHAAEPDHVERLAQLLADASFRAHGVAPPLLVDVDAAIRRTERTVTPDARALAAALLELGVTA